MTYNEAMEYNEPLTAQQVELELQNHGFSLQEYEAEQGQDFIPAHVLNWLGY